MSTSLINEPFIKLPHEIYENIITRAFTEKQLKIISLIVRLSWGCNNNAWKYDSYSDFNVIGVYKSDVAGHLCYLSNNNVITWNRDYKLVRLNKNYEKWTIPVNKTFKKDIMAHLIHKSLKNTNEVRKLLTVLDFSSNEVSDISEHHNSYKLDNMTDRIAPKESIKENIINTTAATATNVPEILEKVCAKYQLEISNTLSAVVKRKLTQCVEEFDYKLICFAIEKAALSEHRSMNYIENVLRRWKGDGISTIQDAENEQKSWDKRRCRVPL